jgi:hypothetical protein
MTAELGETRMFRGPWDEPDEDSEEMQEAREEMDEFLEEAERDPFKALDRDIEDNPLFPDHEDEINDARLTAYGMMDDSFDE